MIGIGIDTGGTCTDAVIYDLDQKKVLACSKSLTTHENLEQGIKAALNGLPGELIQQAGFISLSTTLATNACVENKGGRVCLIFIGVKQETVEETYQNYGFAGTDFMRFLPGDPQKKQDPDWGQLEDMLPDICHAYDSIALAQIHPLENGGAYEKEARERIRKRYSVPVVCAYEIFKDLNVVKRGAGALLNARLIPVVEDFFRAVRHVLDEAKIPLPFVIMRSDGSLVSEQYSREFPVETLLCGPTASVKGGIELFQEETALVIDMGGTTTDVALIRGGKPVMDEEGVRVGNWQTFVRGIAIDTFALGGDSQVCYGPDSVSDNSYRNKGLYLGSRKVVPISVLAAQYPGIMEELEYLSKRPQGCARPLYEHLVLMKEIAGETGRYTDREREICCLLRSGPLSIRQLANRLGVDVYLLDTKRLETEGILQRSGLTPTDAMILRGDFTGHEPNAAALVLQFLNKCTQIQTSDLPAEIYRLVKERLYVNLVRILWNHDKCRKGQNKVLENLTELAGQAFADWQEKGGEHAFFTGSFSTNAVLIGVGAPIPIFLPDVAGALHTSCRLSDYSGVCNALGAMLGDVSVYETVKIRVEYIISNWDAEREQYKVYADCVKVFSEYGQALQYAGEEAERKAKGKAAACGAGEIYEVQRDVRRCEGDSALGKIWMGVDVTVYVKGRIIT